MITGGKTSAGRTSDSCFLPGSDDLVSDIKLRAAKFMRGLQFDGLEAVQLVRYTANQTINLHYDWYQGTPPLDRNHKPYNRLASFFIYLQADCEGGETWFPNVTVERSVAGQDTNEKLALQVSENGKGFTMRARPGSGLFWMNMQDNIGDRRVLHAGLPVQTGTKIGMNIWVKKNLV
ncbi:hypothetical protein K505DRAFT_327650 [Melanomma pulvis-pyrius CBS 109.77]|uniref:Fe2OG dioxygenase domain-containing protein n=1 Tax=Melanomma pulvis-pyrius CBS 109.77 TaxID=1314802 RepID=A0A6A6X1D3_9PLEO|nr:hypothetical protein K505DRAFT_327650 [Melanomma pulvis-pyrius CBS 109.77]